MYRIMLKSKIQRPVVTEVNLEYEGSITIDSKIMDAADILPSEKVQVVNLNNGSRLETYVIAGKKGSGVICMNGGAARHAVLGDKLIIISYIGMETKLALAHKPKIVVVDDKNRIVEER